MTEFSQELFDDICERIANGESLRSICDDAGMPDKASVFRWLAKGENTELRDQYARARESQADAIVDEIIHIADTEEDASKARNRIDARKWVAGKMRPKKYGDKVQVGGDRDNPIRHAHELTDEALAAIATRSSARTPTET